MQTVHVHPVSGDGIASGTRLINAFAGIADASATKHYVVKVEPGIYDVGATMLEMKPYVDIEGSGQEATVIQGVGTTDTSGTIAVVKGASSSEIRDLQVRCMGSASPPKEIRDVKVNVTGGSSAYGFYVEPGAGSPTSPPRITNSTITVNSDGGIGVRIKPGVGVDVEQSQIRAVGSSTTGILADSSTVRVKSSEVTGTTASVEAWIAEIGATLLGGPVHAGFGTCAGVYDETFTFYASTCP